MNDSCYIFLYFLWPHFIFLDLQNLYQDVLSYQRVVDGLSDKAQSLADTDADPQLAERIDDMKQRYQTMCATAKVSDKTLLYIVL